jgi:hypothetical protein
MSWQGAAVLIACTIVALVTVWLDFRIPPRGGAHP